MEKIDYRRYLFGHVSETVNIENNIFKLCMFHTYCMLTVQSYLPTYVGSWNTAQLSNYFQPGSHTTWLRRLSMWSK